MAKTVFNIYMYLICWNNPIREMPHKYYCVEPRMQGWKGFSPYCKIAQDYWVGFQNISELCDNRWKVQYGLLITLFVWFLNMLVNN